MNKQELLESLAEAFDELGSAVDKIQDLSSEDITAEGTDEHEDKLFILNELKDELNEIPYGNKVDIDLKKDEISQAEEELEAYLEQSENEISEIKYELNKIDWHELFDKQYRIYQELNLGDILY